MQSVSHGHRRAHVYRYYVHCRILLNKSTQMCHYIILSAHDRSFVLCSISIYSCVFNAKQELHIHNNIAYFNDITQVIMQYKYRYMNSQNSIQYATGLE